MEECSQWHGDGSQADYGRQWISYFMITAWKYDLRVKERKLMSSTDFQSIVKKL